mgnify:CR=1 FL=1
MIRKSNLQIINEEYTLHLVNTHPSINLDKKLETEFTNLKKEDNQEIENNSILDKTIMLEFIKQSQQFQKEMFSKRKL